jgi:hypothetical protein
MTLQEFLAIYTVSDPAGGRLLKVSTTGGVDDPENYMTISDPAGGRALKVSLAGGGGGVPTTRTLTINGVSYDLSADRSWTVAAGAVNWSETFSSATQATSQWTPNNAAANVNAAITPKGNGSIVAQIPDGTTVGGDARGQFAVDFQRSRTNANQVASANASGIFNAYQSRNASPGAFIGGGGQHTITANPTGGNDVIVGGLANSILSGNGPHFLGGGILNTIFSFVQDSVLVGGRNNGVGGTACVLGGGNGNNLGGSGGVLGGGYTNTSSGSYGFLGGGQSNLVSGQWAIVVGGTQNQATANYAVSVGGFQNLATAVNSAIGGGDRNTASGQNSVIPGGGDHIASGTYSTISGGWASRATAQYSTVKGGVLASASLYGQQVFAAGRFGGVGVFGDAQAHELIWRREITGSVQTELFLDGASVRAILPGTNSIWQGIVDISAICTNAGGGSTVVGEVEATSYKVTIKRIGTNTVLVGTVQEIGTTNADASMATGVFTIDNDDTNESLRIQYTPPTTADATTVIRVLATFRGTQIQY